MQATQQIVRLWGIHFQRPCLLGYQSGKTTVLCPSLRQMTHWNSSGLGIEVEGMPGGRLILWFPCLPMFLRGLVARRDLKTELADLWVFSTRFTILWDAIRNSLGYIWLRRQSSGWNLQDWVLSLGHSHFPFLTLCCQLFLSYWGIVVQQSTVHYQMSCSLPCWTLYPLLMRGMRFWKSSWQLQRKLLIYL